MTPSKPPQERKGHVLPVSESAIYTVSISFIKKEENNHEHVSFPVAPRDGPRCRDRAGLPVGRGSGHGPIADLARGWNARRHRRFWPHQSAQRSAIAG